MNNDIAVILDNVPSYITQSNMAREMNADAAAGISTGFPPSIRIKNGKFRLVDGAGEETAIKAADLKDGEFLDMVVLRAKPGMNKVWYAKAYDPAAEASAPDCMSYDGIKPDSSAVSPQCETCAGCAQNAWGSGRNQSGQPTKGKACSDNKILAVLYKGGVYQFKIPPASLKNWAVFVKNLSTRDCPLGAVIVYAGFDEESDFSILTFNIGGFVPEQAIPKLMTYIKSPEVDEIIVPVGQPAPAAQVAAPAPKPEPKKAAEPVVEVDDIFGDTAMAEPEPEPEPEVEKPAPKKRAAKKKPVEEVVVEAVESDVPSDADIAASLGL
jgi:hypothetical protein